MEIRNLKVILPVFCMEKKSFIRLLPLFLLFFVLLCGWGKMACAGDGKDLYPPDIQRIKQRGRIIVAQFEGIQTGFFRICAP